jgi:hypothetical protein
MKITLAFLMAVATARRMDRCTASGDPHYMPFAGKGKKAKYTLMGEGEFTLAKTTDESFHVSACSWDVSKGRDAATTAGKKLTWNRDFQATDSGVTVKVQGVDNNGDWDYTLTVTGMTGQSDVTHNLGVHTAAGSWACDAASKGKMCKKFVTNEDEVEVKLLRKNRKATQGHQLVVKFPKTNRIIQANILSPGHQQHKFGKRTLFNINIKVPNNTGKDMAGLCAESKASVRGAAGTAVLEGLKASALGANKCTKQLADPAPEAIGTDELLFGNGGAVDNEFVNGEIKDNACTAAEAAAAVQECSRVAEDDLLGCVLDQLATCDTEGVADLIQFEQDQADYTCPLNSYISAATWPLVSFEDCTCMWGHTRDDDAETCTPSELPITVEKPDPVQNGACFCDSTAPRHCMHNNDGSCGLPVLVSDGSSACDDPSKAMSAECVCSQGTTDCTGSKYSIEFSTQPSMASPAVAFGQQPIIKLVDSTGAVVKDSKTKVRISIANVQSDECRGCNEQKPCLHDNVGDNTCHAKHELFGDQVCPPGTTECLPKQSTTKLYQNNAEENPNNKDSLFRKTKECRMTHETSDTTFCSGMTPCKHMNDGTCVQKTAFYSQKVEEEPVNTETCRGTAFWRRAVPSPTTGWFFTTDSSCTMKGALGCADDGHSYAMDKWCDHNCHPRYPGQPAFCPASHCTCQVITAPPTPETPDWRCPADRLNDGTCRCTPGTEFCGAIETTLVNGVGAFEHLTIGTEGRYQLLVEVVMPDQNTGSNNVRVTGTTSVFDVVYPKTRGTTCRAQAQWRKPAMYDSKAHGEGKAWFYEDSKKCLTRSNDGTCGTVDNDVEYAMDKWCKANNCAAFTLANHCEFYTPASSTVSSTCASEKYDMFGDCCHANNVDACGVCGGDGSTCKVTSYMAAPVEVTGDIAVIFNAVQADSSCDIKNPCMHLNDGTCLPKTFNSPQLQGENQHCFWDRQATADQQSNWKYGTWDVEGRMSKSILTPIDVAKDPETDLYYPLETGNQDCYCSAGTIDISKKLEVEDKAKEDFVETLKTKVDKIKIEVTDGVNPPEVQLLAASNAATAYNTANCEGQSIALSSIHYNILCGTHWKNSGGIGSCTGRGNLKFTYDSTPKNTCLNDQVRSIMLPPMTTAKLYKHCKAPTASGQVRYPTLENFGITAKCVDVPSSAFDFSNVVLEGNVLQVDAKVVGTEADYFESQCHPYVEKCLEDATCKTALQAAEALVSGSSSDFLAALKDMAPAVANKPFKNLLVCSGLNAFGLEPTTDSLKDIVVDSVPTVSKCKMIRPVQAIQPIIAKRQESVTRFAASFGAESLFGHRRLVGAGTTTAMVQVSTSGNQGAIGAATTSPASAAQFTAGSSAVQGTSSAGGVGAAGTALIAIGCVGVAVAVVAGLATRKKSMDAPKAQISNSNAVTQQASNEDQTDVL